MVFFSCDKCAESLKKNKVDAHAMRCGCASVSCVDCSVSFWGDDYKQHTSCVTEAERYEKTVYKGPKKNETKGRKLTPQESWMEIINDSFEKCPPAATSYLETLSSYDNVPRKEKAFRNFAANSLNLRGAHGDAIVSSIWSHLSSVREEKLKDQAKLKEQEQAVIETSKEKVETDTESASNAQAKKSDIYKRNQGRKEGGKGYEKSSEKSTK
mmetsp:Transcript_14846/g.22252  ORF Transcript_14846/g.22252 Transcript_14846/m.22252 type:complete len:212 (+) Transcript_14846:19-654(+)